MTRPLRIAVIHYHLKRGGVTRVIESALQGLSELDQEISYVVLSGEIPKTFAEPKNASEVPGLRYSNILGSAQPDACALMESLKAAAIKHLGALPDVWHFHNHSLGKNSAMPGVISMLAKEKAALLLQMHDFAEDGRPENYRLNQVDPAASELYPCAPQIEYAVLNNRDFANFKTSGISNKQIHILPNPIEGNSNSPTPKQQEVQAVKNKLNAKRLFLYPVRAVRRKNLGEFILWSLYAEDGDQFATTLGPTNKNFRKQYEQWKQFASDNKLPVHFAIGEQAIGDFETIVSAADSILTTSIAEGFGLAFLEPWQFGKAIIGRDLPQITEDFKEKGIELDNLYTNIGIPIEWITLDHLRQQLKSMLQATYEAYKMPLPHLAVDRALQAIMVDKNHIDFAGLDESLQIKILDKLIKSPELKTRILFKANFDKASSSQIHTNIRIIREQFGLPNYAKTLSSLYTKLYETSREVPTFLDSNQLLKAFLTPENFRLLRT